MKILRFDEAVEFVGISRSGIYRRIADNDFPKPIPLGPRARGFYLHELERWLEQQAAKRETV